MTIVRQKDIRTDDTPHQSEKNIVVTLSGEQRTLSEGPRDAHAQKHRTTKPQTHNNPPLPPARKEHNDPLQNRPTTIHLHTPMARKTLEQNTKPIHHRNHQQNTHKNTPTQPPKTNPNNTKRKSKTTVMTLFTHILKGVGANPPQGGCFSPPL